MILNRRVFAAASVAASIVLATAVSVVPASAAPRKDVTLGVRLEPPHLDPTAGAAAAIGEIVYANVFEGLTRIDRNAGVKPGAGRELGRSRRTARPTRSPCARARPSTTARRSTPRP